MSTHTPTDWPTQLFLPGQTAAPEGPVDMQMMYVLHHAFRRDLDRFVAAARTTPATDRVTWHLLSGRWQVFCEQLHHHHEGEDRAIWPCLREHGSADDVATLDAMEAEHAEIDPLLSACATPVSTGWTRTTTRTRAPRSPFGSSPLATTWPGTSPTRRATPSRSCSA